MDKPPKREYVCAPKPLAQVNVDIHKLKKPCQVARPDEDGEEESVEYPYIIAFMDDFSRYIVHWAYLKDIKAQQPILDEFNNMLAKVRAEFGEGQEIGCLHTNDRKYFQDVFKETEEDS